MRPIKLMMQAFGPYAGKEMIDFTKLGNRTMFVISGKTGSGKTTIFDGISFAIFGRASGDDRGGSDLRSHFADEDVVTEVSMQFALKDKLYYIWRTPQQEKKKARGEGYTTVGAKAELYILAEDGSRKLLAANVRDTDEKIKEIIQLDANQFRQILMIPQGEFRKLLTSDSREKELILQKLFRTELYKRIEDKMKEKANSLKSQVELGVSERTRLLKGIIPRDHEELVAALSETNLNDLIILQLLDDVVNNMKSDLAVLSDNMKQQKQQRDNAKRQVDAAEDLLKQIAARDDLIKQKSELDKQEDHIEQIKIEIEKAGRANHLAHQENLCHRLKKALDEYEKELNDQQEKVKSAEKSLDNTKELLEIEEKRQDQRENVNNELMKLHHLRDDIYSFTERQAELKVIEDELAACKTEIQTNQLKLEILKQELTEHTSRLKNLESIRLQAFEKEKQLVYIEGTLKSLHSLNAMVLKSQELNKKLNTHEQIVKKVRDSATDAKEILKVIEDKWHDGQAGLLAHQLKTGVPCPVCGSDEHPVPATFSSHMPSEVDLKAAKTDVDEFNRELLEAERVWLRFVAEAETVQGAISEKRSEVEQLIPEFSLQDIDLILESYEGKHVDAKRSLADDQAEISQIHQLEEKVLEQEKNADKINIILQELMAKEQQLFVKHTEAATVVNNLIRNIPDHLKTKKQYDSAVAAAEIQKKKLDTDLENARSLFSQKNEQLAGLKGTIVNLESQVRKSREELDVERKIFLKQLEDEKFSTYKDYHESKRPQSAIDVMNQKIRSYREEYRSITDRLSDYEMRLKGVEKPDMDILQKQFQEKEQVYSVMSEQQAALVLHIHKNEEIRSNVEKVNEEIKAAEQQYELIGHLADITRGQNTYRLTFERFVLASFLDEILHAANVRLVKMSSGRYQLLRKTDRSKGNVQSGLELLVFDQYTGQERHVKTLSGGESFKAALSLALGLADVVQEHAGGVSLETMFIDEGFGTLDPESLDHAIEALMDIQSSGRLVGIISHVPELKERMDARLEVIACQNGSKTEFRFLG